MLLEIMLMIISGIVLVEVVVLNIVNLLMNLLVNGMLVKVSRNIDSIMFMIGECCFSLV